MQNFPAEGKPQLFALMNALLKDHKAKKAFAH